MANVSDYPDAVQRIANAHVDPDATTQQEVQQALRGADAPQVTQDVAQGMAEALVTEERVKEAIRSTGELPTSREIDAITSVSDDYDMDQRVQKVAEKLHDSVASVEDIEQAVRERKVTGRPMFREEVDTAVDQVSSRKELIGASADEVASEQAREVGAPRENDFRREVTQTIAKAEQITPSEVIEGTSAKTPVQVIRDESGQAVAATGGPSRDIGQKVAQQQGVDYMSTEQVTQEINTEGSGDTVDLTLRGRDIGDVPVR